MTEPIRLNLGGGNTHYDGFTSVDKYDEDADVRADICELPFDDNSVDEIKCYQTVEHINYNLTEQMFQEMHRVLKPGGFAHIECPDMMYAAQSIIDTGDIEQKWVQHIWGEYYRPWDEGRYGPGATNHVGSKHVTGFTFKRLQRICEPMGFVVTPSVHLHMNVPETLSVQLTKPGGEDE